MDLNSGYVTGVAHIGIAVPSIEDAEKQYRMLGFTPVNAEIIPEKEYGVKVLMMRQGSFSIELLEPYEKGKESPIDSYISTKPYKMYHLAYYVTNLDEQIKLLEKQKFITIAEPKPSVAMNGARAVFLFNRSMGIIELIERKEREHG